MYQRDVLFTENNTPEWAKFVSKGNSLSSCDCSVAGMSLRAVRHAALAAGSRGDAIFMPARGLLRYARNDQTLRVFATEHLVIALPPIADLNDGMGRGCLSHASLHDALLGRRDMRSARNEKWGRIFYLIAPGVGNYGVFLTFCRSIVFF